MYSALLLRIQNSPTSSKNIHKIRLQGNKYVRKQLLF